MNLAEWAPAIITVLAAVFTYGRSVQTQKNHSDRLDTHDEHLEAHAEHLGRIDIALVRLEEYNRGLSDGARLGAK